MNIEPVATFHSPLSSKFGIPRQSGVVPELAGEIRLEGRFRREEALRGLEGFSHLWLIWGFSANRETASESLLVRPPRLGGNRSVGVFASRSPYRPNPLGLSSVKILSIDADKGVIRVAGADLMDGTPVYDIKPYIPYTDSKTDALGSFAEEEKDYALNVDFPEELLEKFPNEKREGILAVLADDPRPSYQNDVNRIYGVSYAGFNVKFRVSEDNLKVVDVLPLD